VHGAERAAGGIANIGSRVIQGCEQRVEGARVADFAKRGGGALGGARVRIGQG
jgi:hypothetical protein